MLQNKHKQLKAMAFPTHRVMTADKIVHQNLVNVDWKNPTAHAALMKINKGSFVKAFAKSPMDRIDLKEATTAFTITVVQGFTCSLPYWFDCTRVATGLSSLTLSYLRHRKPDL